jgi:N-acetylneuraminate synthase
VKLLGQNHVYIIAEAGVNHNGCLNLALELVDCAASAGADAVKFQTFNAEKLVTTTAPTAAYQEHNGAAGDGQLAMLKDLELPHSWHHTLKCRAAKKGIAFLSTAFEKESLDFLAGLDLPFFKVPSGELTNAPLLWEFARLGKDLVVSTGMATLSDVEFALAVIAHARTHQSQPTSSVDIWQSWSQPDVRAKVNNGVTLLHCTSQYPTPMDQVNLNAMDTLRDAFGLPVGYSDHTQGILVPVAAVARGATIIEKHFTISRALPGPDHAASLEPGELKQMVHDIRALRTCFGTGYKSPQPNEWNTREAARKHIIAAQDIPAGDTFNVCNLTCARANAGADPSKYWDLLGTQSMRAFTKGDPII